MIADCTALILAGGESRRMGRDKASLILGERSLLEHVAGALFALFPQVLLSVRTPRRDLEHMALPQVCDVYPQAGPLAGLHAGLGRAKSPWVFAVATDMPFLNAALIERLAGARGDCDAVVPVVGGCPQPLAAFYATACLSILRAQLEGGERRSLRALLEQLRVRFVDESELVAADPGLRSFFDLDTPRDLAVARHMEE